MKRKIPLSILFVLTASILMTMVFISVKLRDTLVNDSKVKTQELAVTIDANLHHSVRENDLVFRYGGEEFTVILPATNIEGAQS